jgi:putative toxin-antitoxin system antitoxin component (TIGR02293 family)
MAERQHTTGQAGSKRFKRATVVGDPSAMTEEDKRNLKLQKLRARDELLRVTDKAEEVYRREPQARPGLPGDPFEGFERETLAGMTSTMQEILDLFGGDGILGSTVKSELDAHALLHRGLPRGALTSLIDKLHDLPVAEVSEALGMSLRTLQRHKTTPVELLDVQQSGRAWKFAEILAKATRVLGSQDEAEQWLRRPAIGLDQRRPVELLTTPAGVKLVEDYLGRLEYDVYT